MLLLAAIIGRGSAAAAMPQDATNTDAGGSDDKPLTGRALRCENGRIKTFECRNVELLSFLPKDSLAESVGTDLWGWHDSTTGREFAITGGEATAFVEVTDPLHPRYLGVLHPHPGSERHAAQSVRVYQHYAFIGYEGTTDHGLQIFDLTQLRDVKSPQEFKETTHYDSLGRTHTIAVDPETGFLYANGGDTCGGGLHMVDVRTPINPMFVGCYTNMEAGQGANIGGFVAGSPGSVHDTQCVRYRGPDRQYVGREICLNSAGDGVVIVDVTDKKQPKTVSIARYPNSAYTHQGWFTEDQRYFFLDDELDEGTVGHTRTIGLDLADLADPVVMTEFLNMTTDTDHNLFVRGHYMYQGNYGAGLRIIDITDPKNLKEVGYLTNIGAAWGTYPFFKNDVVAVPTDRGLFLARLLKP